MKILFAAWEIDPFFKVGGLGDIARSLPGALCRKGLDVRVVIPYYKVIKLFGNKKKLEATGKTEYDGKSEYFEIYSVIHPTTKVIVYLIKNKTYIDKVKSPDMFAFFDKAVVTMVKDNLLSWQPAIIHCNDHHTGYIPIIVKDMGLPVKTMYTIHNLAHQGISSAEIIDKLKIRHNKFGVQAWEIKSRQLNAMLEGIVHSDVVNTVSPNYAREIMTEKYGMGLDEILRGREGRVFGILNGIDLSHNLNLQKVNVSFPYLEEKISCEEKHREIRKWQENKEKNKSKLQKELGLKVTSKIPLFSFVGRVDAAQKGMDILHRMFRRIDLEQMQFILLGTGNPEWEERFQWLSTFFPKNVSCNFFFDSGLATRIYASSDFLLIPSKFEPCGLIQMLGMFFGTVPIAHKTGGLADSIKTGENGFLFEEYAAESLERAVKKAIGIWQNDKPKYKKIAENAMLADFSWDKSADEYIKLYERLVKGEL